MTKHNEFRTGHSKRRRMQTAAFMVLLSHLCSYAQRIVQPETVSGAGEMAEQSRVHGALSQGSRLLPRNKYFSVDILTVWLCIC